MADLESTSWDETDANNTARFPEGQNPSTVNDGARALEGAIKREWNRSHATRTSAGAASLTFTVSYSVNPTTYVRGCAYVWKAHQNCGNAARFGISGLATKLMMKPTKGGLVTISQSDIVTDQIVRCDYDTSLDAMVVTSGLALPITIGTVQMVIAGTGLSGGSISGTGTIALDMSALTATASVSLSDFLPFYDGANQRRATVSNVLNKSFATQAQMEAQTANRVVTADVAKFAPGDAKAWCVFDGSVTTLSVTLAAAHNVTSVTKVATGRFLITFTTPFSSINYIGSGVSDVASVMIDSGGTKTASAYPVRFLSAGGANTDPTSGELVFFGDQ
jgi:hypothetical protein